MSPISKLRVLARGLVLLEALASVLGEEAIGRKRLSLRLLVW
jgi:hypothetical protein